VAEKLQGRFTELCSKILVKIDRSWDIF